MPQKQRRRVKPRSIKVLARKITVNIVFLTPLEPAMRFPLSLYREQLVDYKSALALTCYRANLLGGWRVSSIPLRATLRQAMTIIHAETSEAACITEHSYASGRHLLQEVVAGGNIEKYTLGSMH